MDKAVFLGLNALGDFLCTTPALRAFRKQNPETQIIYIVQSAGFTRILEHNPDIDLLVFSDRLFVQGMPDQIPAWLRTMPIDLRKPATLFQMDLKHACKSPDDLRRHMSEAFAKIVNVELDSKKPTVVLTENDRRGARIFTDRPYVVFSTQSVSNPERDDGRGRKKDWPVENWRDLAERIHQTGAYDILTLGAENEQPLDIPHARSLYGLPIRTVAALVEEAACVVTLENGIGHLCAGLDARAVVIYSNMMPIEWAGYGERPNARELYGDPLETTCDQVFAALEEVIAPAAVLV